MPLIQWKDDYSVHLETLDLHHRQFVDIINRLYDSTMTADDIATVQPIIDELVGYTAPTILRLKSDL